MRHPFRIILIKALSRHSDPGEDPFDIIIVLLFLSCAFLLLLDEAVLNAGPKAEELRGAVSELDGDPSVLIL